MILLEEGLTEKQVYVTEIIWVDAPDTYSVIRNVKVGFLDELRNAFKELPEDFGVG